MSRPRRFGVLGWPVAHSRSPAMHNAAFGATGLHDHRYQRLPVPPAAFAETVAALPAAGFAGANVTIPHKEAALALAGEATAAARAIGAANTLTFDATGAVRAGNTDAPGLLAAIGAPLPADALVLGAGGSARAAAWALAGAGVHVRLWNRTADRAERVAAAVGVEVAASATRAALLVNATSAGLADPAETFKELPLDADDLGEYACVVDLVYRDGGTRLLDEAARRGCRTVDGLEVLVQQGALSFEAWTGRSAPVDVMRRAAHGELVPQTAPSDARPGRRGARP